MRKITNQSGETRWKKKLRHEDVIKIRPPLEAGRPRQLIGCVLGTDNERPIRWVRGLERDRRGGRTLVKLQICLARVLGSFCLFVLFVCLFVCLFSSTGPHNAKRDAETASGLGQ